MRSNRVLGIIFSNTQNPNFNELTSVRTIGSVPFGGRYRFIDFVLSNMVNSGIDKVGVITRSNYQSLLDHLGSGKAWDLSRKSEGLYILPPFGHGGNMVEGKVETIASNASFFRNSNKDYVVLSDSDVVMNIDIQQVVDSHIQNEADITVVYKNGVAPTPMDEKLIFKFDDENKATDMLIGVDKEDACSYGLKMYVMRKDYLLDAVQNAVSRNRINFARDIIAPCFESGKLYGYCHDGYAAAIGNLKQYFDANMDLMSFDIRNELFKVRPIYTKVHDEMPAVYGLGSNAYNSLVADGCTVHGEINNCILFRGVTVAEGAKLNNCIIMQGTQIGANANLEYVIIDKNVTVKSGRKLTGCESYPVFISKGNIV